MVLLYLFIGFIAAVIAAAPPGAANIVVINTTLKEDLRKALYIALGAGIGEVILSFVALHCTMNFTEYFKENPWLQIVTFSLFIAVGIYFLLRKWLGLNGTGKRVTKLKTPKPITGFLLAILNPPVLIFWVLAFTIIHKYVLKVSEMSPFLTLFLFFLGVYLGKVATLYAYGRWSKKLEEKEDSHYSKKDLIIGSALVFVGIIQGAKFFITQP